MKVKMTIILRALNMVDGAVGEYLRTHDAEDAQQVCWQSMTWLNDWFDRYYIGWDFSRNGYVVEWRKPKEDTRHPEKVCIGVIGGMCYQDDTARIIKKMIKQHKEDLKNESK